jgi:hypothetical protein
MESVRLAPLSECEIQNKSPTFLNKLLLQEAPSSDQTRVREHLLNRLVVGCFPEPLQCITILKPLTLQHARVTVLYPAQVNSLA